MPATINYNRDKDPSINATGIVVSAEQRESDGARTAIAAGTTGIFEVFVRADADESGAADVQDLYQVVITPIIQQGGAALLAGAQQVTVTITPILGDGTVDTPNASTTALTHPETADAWQSAAGRARQV